MLKYVSRRREVRKSALDGVFGEMFREEVKRHLPKGRQLNTREIHEILCALSGRLLSGELDEKVLIGF